MIDKSAYHPDRGMRLCVNRISIDPRQLSYRANSLQTLMETRPENRIFWPLVAAISVILALRIVLDLLFLPISSVFSRILRLPGQASCGLSSRSSRLSDLRNK